VADVDVEEVVVSDSEVVVGVVSADVKVVGSAAVVGVVVVGAAVVVSEVRVVGTGSEVAVVAVSAVLAVVSEAKEVEVVSAGVLVSVSAGVLVGVVDGSDVADAVVAEETVAAVSPVLREVALVLLADMINKGLNVNWVDAGLEVGAMLAMLRDERIHETSWDSALESKLRRRQDEAREDKVTTMLQIDRQNSTKQRTGVIDDTDCLDDARRVHMVKQSRE
jgi:hypothetical protein